MERRSGTLLAVPLAQRFSYDPGENLFFVNFERLPVKSMEDIDRIRREVESRLAPLGHRVYAIVNYDEFSIEPELVDAHTEMVKGVVERFYSGVTRYTTSTFPRMKLGDALAGRSVAPHIYETEQEARSQLRQQVTA